MGLPAPNTSWPPAAEHNRYRRMAVNATWYAGDPERLAALYGGLVPAGSTRKNRRFLGVLHDWFWGTTDENEPDDKVHVPVAQDVATLSADLLFSSPPTCTVLEASTTQVATQEDGEMARQAEQALVDAAQARLDDILKAAGFDAVLPAAAETAAALGGVGLRIGWEPGMQAPTITRVDADATCGEWAFGLLQAVTFWRIVAKNDAEVWYHLERHERGGVYHGLYKGKADSLGERMPLTASPVTAGYADQVDEEGWMPLVPGYLCATVVPNMLPDPLDRMSGAGRSDYSPGVLTLFDSIDKTATSMMRDLDDGRSRLVVADYMLKSRKPGEGVEFDQNQHVFTPLAMNPSENGEAPITQVQFALRVEEHLRLLDYWVNLALKECGYNSDSEMGEGGDMTATEYLGRQRRSASTRAKKERYWVAALEPLLEALLAFDAQFVRPATPVRPVSVTLAPMAVESLASLAGTAEVLARAKAASLSTLVATVHPDWTPEEVAEEVAALRAEYGTALPDAVPTYEA